MACGKKIIIAVDTNYACPADASFDTMSFHGIQEQVEKREHILKYWQF